MDDRGLRWCRACWGNIHKDKWQEIDAALLTLKYREAAEQCWAKFDQDFGGWDLQELQGG